LHEKYKNDGFLVLGISMDRATMEKIRSYILRHNITFPNVHDSTFQVAERYRVNGVPMTFFIDAKGKARGFAVGLRPWMSPHSRKLVRHFLSEAH